MIDAVLRQRLVLYALGWTLLLLSAGLEVSNWGGGRQRLWRYDPSEILVLVAVLVLLVTSAAAIVATIRKPQMRYLAGIIAAVLVSIPFLATGLWPADRLAEPVCGKTSGCHFLTVAPVFTDTVYEVWHAPEPGVWAARRVDTRGFSYSEDGSYIAGAHLKLSGNERILVLARGGYLVDAIDLGTGKVLASDIGAWNDPEREARMRENSARIQSLLDANV